MKKSLKLSLKIIITLAILAMIALRMVLYANQFISENGLKKLFFADIASGTVGTCNWTIDADGLLTIGPGTLTYTPTYENYATLNNYPIGDGPWHDYASQVTGVNFSGTVTLGTGQSSVSLFRDFVNLTYIKNFDNFNTENAQSMAGMFFNCQKLESISPGNTIGSYIDFGNSFYTPNLTNMSYMFYNCKSATLISFKNSRIDTSNVVTGMQGLFRECRSLQSMNLSKFNTRNVNNMAHFFDGCNELSKVVYGNTFYTDEVTSMGWFFKYCKKLRSVSFPDYFNTEKLTNVNNMFSNCYSLITIDISHLNTENATNFDSMFQYCTRLEHLNIESLNTSNATSMKAMFKEDILLKDIQFGSGFSTSHVTDMENMFYGCSRLSSLDLSSFDTSAVNNMHGMFYQTKAMNEVVLSSNFSFKGNGITDSEKWAILNSPFDSPEKYKDLELDTPYTGKWIKSDHTGNAYTAKKLRDIYDGSTMSGTWVWEEGKKIKYAVQIYGINQDEDENGNPLGLTFGPATGADYNNSYVTHEYEETSSGSGTYYVKIVTHTISYDMTETTSFEYLSFM